MRHLIETLEKLARTDHERALKLKNVLPQTVWRWRNQKNFPSVANLIENPILAHAVARDADEQAELQICNNISQGATS